MNTYGYVGGNPVNSIDPFGLAVAILGGGGTGALGLGGTASDNSLAYGTTGNQAAAIALDNVIDNISPINGENVPLSVLISATIARIVSNVCSSEDDKDCRKIGEKDSRWPGVPIGFKQCIYACKTASGQNIIHRFIPEGTSCPETTNWVDGTQRPPTP